MLCIFKFKGFNGETKYLLNVSTEVILHFSITILKAMRKTRNKCQNFYTEKKQVKYPSTSFRNFSVPYFEANSFIRVVLGWKSYSSLTSCLNTGEVGNMLGKLPANTRKVFNSVSSFLTSTSGSNILSKTVSPCFL